MLHAHVSASANDVGNQVPSARVVEESIRYFGSVW